MSLEEYLNIHSGQILFTVAILYVATLAFRVVQDRTNKKE